MSAIDRTTVERVLPECLAVDRWVLEVAAAAPFASLDELLERANAAAASLSDQELEQALSHHPRIGERAEGAGLASAFSRREQASADADDAELSAAIADGNRAYEARFDRVFLIRAAGRNRAEILAELNRRLHLDDASERETVVTQLREIALLRIRAALTEGVAP